MLRSQLKRFSEEPIVRGQNAHPSSGGDPNLFWRRGIFATIVQLEKPIATLYLADKPTRVLSHCCARAMLEARGCEIVSKVILPGYRWFAQQARAFIITALSRNSKCGFALRWTPSFVGGGVWDLGLDCPSTPRASRLCATAEAAAQSYQILAPEWVFWADSPGLAPPLSNTGRWDSRSKHSTKARHSLPRSTTPHWVPNTRRVPGAHGLSRTVPATVGSAGPTSSRDGTTAPVYYDCGSLAQPRVKGPESRDRRKRPGAQLIDPQRGTGCNCLRDGGEPDGNA
ncbi:hypothetical protein MRS44_010297 [Fusarium solani]|uniref:uncharacterized protein n=1 Tax=Fusarium solani TaxID=169388 RepID=UPI0032C40F52|nr:hypothetical protein MRS44_010297 [Fusarium solani]